MCSNGRRVAATELPASVSAAQTRRSASPSPSNPCAPPAPAVLSLAMHMYILRRPLLIATAPRPARAVCYFLYYALSWRRRCTLGSWSIVTTAGAVYTRCYSHASYIYIYDDGSHNSHAASIQSCYSRLLRVRRDSRVRSAVAALLRRVFIEQSTHRIQSTVLDGLLRLRQQL